MLNWTTIITGFLRGEYYLEVKEWEEKRRLGKDNQRLSEGRGQKGFVNSQNLNPVNTTHDLAKTLSIGEQTASRIIQIHGKQRQSSGVRGLTMARTLTPERQQLKQQAISLRYDYGKTVRQIAGQLDVKKSTIDLWVSSNSRTTLSNNNHHITHLEGDCL